MNPAFSVIVFTTVAGAAQGLVVALALAALGETTLAPTFTPRLLLLAAALLVIGLGASFLHLGRPERAWRAAAMWRSSWLSREVIVLPAFIGVVIHRGALSKSNWSQTLGSKTKLRVVEPANGDRGRCRCRRKYRMIW